MNVEFCLYYRIFCLSPSLFIYILLGVFMDRVPEPNKISVQVPEISGREQGDPHPNRKLSGTRYRVPDNFGSGYWVTNNPITTNLLFAFFLAK